MIPRLIAMTLALTAPAVAAAEAPAESPFALSIGTGPRPLDTLTLGLTGLGARAMLPLGRAIPFVGLSASSVTIADFNDGRRSERFISRVSSIHVSPGVRVDLATRGDDTVVLPYVAIGGLVGRAAVASGFADDDQLDAIGTTSFGLLGGLGFDGFVTRHLSLGAELGVMGALSLGASRFDGDVEDRFDTTVLTSFTSLQATVWR
jgi:hypothetical protein